MFGLIPFERDFDRDIRGLGNMFAGFGDCSLMQTDIREDENSYVLSIDLPGFAKENISLSADDGRLTVTAERKQESEEGEGRFVRRERVSGKFSRSFSLDGIDENAITAGFENGVLSVTLPKAKELAPKKIDIA